MVKEEKGIGNIMEFYTKEVKLCKQLEFLQKDGGK